MLSAATGGRDVDDGGIRAGLLDGFGDGVEHRDRPGSAGDLGVLAALAGRDATDDLRAVLDGFWCGSYRSCR